MFQIAHDTGAGNRLDVFHCQGKFVLWHFDNVIVIGIVWYANPEYANAVGTDWATIVNYNTLDWRSSKGETNVVTD